MTSALTAEQNRALQDFQGRARPTYADVEVPECLRFLRARQYDVDKAYAMFDKARQWRKMNNVDSILDKPDAQEHVYEALTPHLDRGYDKMGRPVYIERSGKVNVNNLLKVLTPDMIIRRHIRHQELVLQRMKESPVDPNIEKQTVILDLKSLSLRPDSVGMKLFKKTIDIDQNYYPERLGNMIIINAGILFRALWRLISAWVDPVTKEKFHIYGADYQDKLQKYIDADQLPPQYGGTAPWDLPDVKEYSGDTYLDCDYEYHHI